MDAQVLFLGGQPQLRPVRQAADSPSVITKADMTATTGTASAVTTPLSMIHFKGIIQDVQVILSYFNNISRQYCNLFF